MYRRSHIVIDRSSTANSLSAYQSTFFTNFHVGDVCHYRSVRALYKNICFACNFKIEIFKQFFSPQLLWQIYEAPQRKRKSAAYFNAAGHIPQRTMLRTIANCI